MEFSVLMSIYHKENSNFFREAIDSILKQTVMPKEIVIVKDGPLTSELDKILEEYSNKFPLLFKIINLDKNLGLGLALKRGVEECSYDLIARMDTDDIALNKRFEKQIEYFEKNPDIDIVGTNALDFNTRINNIVSKRVYPEDNIQIKKMALRRCPFLHPTIMFKKKAVIQVGNYENLLWFEDYYLFLKLINNGYKGYNIQEYLLFFRSNEDTFKRRGGFNYIVQEYKALTLFYKKRYFNLWLYLSNLIIRFFVRIVGNSTRKVIYTKFLRNS